VKDGQTSSKVTPKPTPKIPQGSGNPRQLNDLEIRQKIQGKLLMVSQNMVEGETQTPKMHV